MKFSKSAIVFVDRSLLPARLLEFYAQKIDRFNANDSVPKFNKSVWFDLPINLPNEHFNDCDTTFIGDLGKCSGKYRMTLPNTTGLHTMGSRINLRMHVPRGNVTQCPIIIATAEGLPTDNKIRRRSSDSKIKNFMEVGKHPISLDAENPNYSEIGKKRHKNNQAQEEFSIAINMKTIVSLGQETQYGLNQKERNKFDFKDMAVDNVENNFSLAFFTTGNEFDSFFQRHYFRQNSF